MKLSALFLVIVTVMVSGCASSYRPPADAPLADVSFDLRSGTSGTTGKFFSVFPIDDLSCTPSRFGGRRLVGSLFANDHEMLGPVQVVAGVTFGFLIKYSESRVAQNRDCDYIASFTPVAGERYTVKFSVGGEGTRCDVRIKDGGGQDIDYQKPEFVCAVRPEIKVRNGTGGIVNWKVRIQ